MNPTTTPNAKSNSRGYGPYSRAASQKRPAARKPQGVAEAQKPTTTTHFSSHIRGETSTSNQLMSSADNKVAPASPDVTSALLINGPAVIPNILIFGETGTGKSSVLNMIAGEMVAGVSGDAQGHTFEGTQHSIIIDGKTQVTFWDTAGLNEGENGTVPAIQAMKDLQDLVGNLHKGLSLLVYCIRGSRFRDIWKVNYDLFTGVICQGKVPVVLVVTGLENESPMENWWTENGEELARHGMTFDGHACITSTRGKQLKSGEHMYQEEFEESKIAARKLVVDHCMGSPWVVDKRTWLSEITSKMASYYEAESSLERNTSNGRVMRNYETRSPSPSYREPEARGRGFEARQQRGGEGVNLLSSMLYFFRDCLTYLMADSRQVESGRHRDRQYQS